ncbi:MULTISPECIES: maleylpyruvate isomerase family mycothiol-dependent enzyme [unclassified Arthrobacter]|uniref:maleylpyruvate isomerase N-terminal domain-containing protein n=1 Tax=unclassified Arthrobacter TaxID=235627 RepID=UPI0024DF924D|nr:MULTISPECIES: maleylpyruvate isomerase family mycothiol-dependent enzyme [unclassified Arthrobacter]MCC9146796.1 maleylpyruvate isomerase family mycothiol-dependent enzyme [Arthrobacter sp. zg-Y919]MDK1278027.1 maleylpyruvate isomerase family mycothiol-dependent enzyme [Arthrobacter sp. zg.Y919]WIB03383.1 maleylpyruvate isomerase family mycothiol-dependent enzyme [Arthrobacter sp. zg-Y919]
MNLEADPERASQMCVEAQARLLDRVATVTDVRSPSRLPGWTVGHVLSHLARNADAHARRLAGALDGHDVPRYPGGSEQRARDIEEGAGLPAAAIIADLRSSMLHLEQVLALSAAAGWPNGHLMGNDDYPVAGCPAHRLREVEMHHVDLGLGYTPSDWPEEYVAWDLPLLLATVPERLGSLGQRREFMAWLAGRGPLAPDTKLADW